MEAVTSLVPKKCEFKAIELGLEPRGGVTESRADSLMAAVGFGPVGRSIRGPKGLAASFSAEDSPGI